MKVFLLGKINFFETEFLWLKRAICRSISGRGCVRLEWLAYPAAEALTLIVTLAGMRKVLRIGNE